MTPELKEIFLNRYVQNALIRSVSFRLLNAAPAVVLFDLLYVAVIDRLRIGMAEALKPYPLPLKFTMLFGVAMGTGTETKPDAVRTCDPDVSEYVPPRPNRPHEILALPLSEFTAFPGVCSKPLRPPPPPRFNENP